MMAPDKHPQVISLVDFVKNMPMASCDSYIVIFDTEPNRLVPALTIVAYPEQFDPEPNPPEPVQYENVPEFLKHAANISIALMLLSVALDTLPTDVAAPLLLIEAITND
jgi:hypothetical protein